jgi:hypothetical protein
LPDNWLLNSAGPGGGMWRAMPPGDGLSLAFDDRGRYATLIESDK